MLLLLQSKHQSTRFRLTENFVYLLPGRPEGPFLPLHLQEPRKVELAAAGDQVDVLRPDDLGLEDDLVDEVRRHDDRERHIRLKEALDAGLTAEREQRYPELHHKDREVEGQAQVGTEHAGLRDEGEVVEGVALDLPGAAEADVAEADGPPGEEGAQAGKGEEPGEHLVLDRAARGDEVR